MLSCSIVWNFVLIINYIIKQNINMKTHLLKIGFLVGLLFIVSNNQLRAFTAVVSGNWSSAATWGGVAPGPNVTAQDIIIPNGITVTLDMDVTFSGLINTFTVDGTLNSSATYSLTLVQGTMAGTGTVDIHRLEYGLLLTSSFTGTLTLNVLENNAALLQLGAVGTVSDSLVLESGTLTLAAGANLAVQTNSTIYRNDGSLTIGGGIFNSSANYNVVYVGASKTSGIELNSLTLQNIYIQLTDNTQTVSLGTNLRVNNTLTLTMGHLDISGYDLELYGNMVVSGGAMFESDNTSNIVIQSSSAINSGFTFAAGSSVDNITVDHTGAGNVKLNSAIDIAGELRLNDGTFNLETGSTIVMLGGSLVHVEDGDLFGNGGSFNGTANYDVEYMGSTHTSGLELSGSGLTDVTINMSSGTNEVSLGGDITANGHLDLVTGKLNMNGNNFTLNGTFDQQSTATIIGNVNSELAMNISAILDDTIYFDNSNQGLDMLTVNVSGGGDLVLGSQLQIHDELSMLAGRLDIGDNNLSIEQGASITGYSDVRYIVTSGVGRLRMYINSGGAYQVYPVGTDVNYSPASIQQLAGGTSGDFMVNTFAGVYTQGTTGFNSAQFESVVDRTWLVESETGLTINMKLKLGWVVASEVNGYDQANTYITHYMGTWDTYASGAATVGLNNTFEIERTGITSLSPFAVIDNNANLGFEDESEASAINLYPNPCTEMINVSNTNITDQYNYEIMDVSGKTFGVINNGSNQFDVSGLQNGFYFLRMTNLSTNKSVVKEFIKK